MIKNAVNTHLGFIKIGWTFHIKFVFLFFQLNEMVNVFRHMDEYRFVQKLTQAY